MTVNAIVLGPDNVPVITEIAEAQADVGFAVFSALTHSRSKQIDGILKTLAAALGTIDADTAALLAQFTEAGLGDGDGESAWRGLMMTQTYPYTTRLRTQLVEEGLAQGLAQAVVQVLDSRGIVMEPADRERILTCRDNETLQAWLSKVSRIADITELFA